MNFLQIILLGLIQGAAELLPVSSSAHVIVAEKLMGLDPSSPEMTFVLVMLHTGTMFAVIVYFWNAWREHYFSSAAAFRAVAINVVIATIITGIVGLALQMLIEKVFLKGSEKAEVEVLFSQLPLIGGALLAVGLLIIYSGVRQEKTNAARVRFKSSHGGGGDRPGRGYVFKRSAGEQDGSRGRGESTDEMGPIVAGDGPCKSRPGDRRAQRIGKDCGPLDRQLADQ